MLNVYTNIYYASSSGGISNNKQWQNGQKIKNKIRVNAQLRLNVLHVLRCGFKRFN